MDPPSQSKAQAPSKKKQQQQGGGGAAPNVTPKKKPASAGGGASKAQANAPGNPPPKSWTKIDPNVAKIDPLFWRTLHSCMAKALRATRRIQAFNTSVLVAEPGINVAEHLYVNEDGVSAHVVDGEQNQIPDLELFSFRVEELIKHSAEPVDNFDAKVEQTVGSPAYMDVANEIMYFQAAFQDLAEAYKMLGNNISLVSKMHIPPHVKGNWAAKRSKEAAASVSSASKAAGKPHESLQGVRPSLVKKVGPAPPESAPKGPGGAPPKKAAPAKKKAAPEEESSGGEDGSDEDSNESESESDDDSSGEDEGSDAGEATGEGATPTKKRKAPTGDAPDQVKKARASPAADVAKEEKKKKATQGVPGGDERPQAQQQKKKQIVKSTPGGDAKPKPKPKPPAPDGDGRAQQAKAPQAKAPAADGDGRAQQAKAPQAKAPPADGDGRAQQAKPPQKHSGAAKPPIAPKQQQQPRPVPEAQQQVPESAEEATAGEEGEGDGDGGAMDVEEGGDSAC